MVWRPRRLVAGLGASSGAPAAELEALLGVALAAADLSPSGLGLLATLQRKLAEVTVAPSGPDGGGGGPPPPSAAPEPTTLVLAGLALPALFMARRRMKKA